MKPLNDVSWSQHKRNKEVSARYDEIAAAPIGSAFLIERGVDFSEDEAASKVRLRYISSLRWRGLRVSSTVQDGNVLIRTLGRVDV